MRRASGAISANLRRTALQPDLLALPAGAMIYTLAAIAASAALLAASLIMFDTVHPAVFVELLGLSALASLVKLASPRAVVPVTSAINVAALLLLGRDAAILVAVAGAWSDTTLQSRAAPSFHRILLAVAAIAFTVTASGLVLTEVRPLLPPDAIGLFMAAGAATLVYLLVGTLLHSGYVALAERRMLSRTWQREVAGAAMPVLGGGLVGAAAAAPGAQGPLWWAALGFAAFYLLYRGCREIVVVVEEQRGQAAEARAAQLATAEALALAIEARDHTSHAQVRVVQRYAEALARAAGLSDDEIWGVRTAALLQDIGNLAVPEHILSKPGELTQEEFEKVKIHPRVSADIVRDVPFWYPVAPIIEAHHERWDGSGYPFGLSGERIPLGARIVAIADAFTAVISNRPYRRALPRAHAIRAIERGAGTAFDPQLVTLFLRVLDRMESEGGAFVSERADQPLLHSVALRNIVEAHREGRELFEFALALGSSLGLADTMASVAAKLQGLVPFSCCALFVAGQDGSFECRFASGEGEELAYSADGRSLQTLTSPLPRRGAARSRDGRRLQSVLVLPLEQDRRPVAALVLYHTSEGAFSYDHRRLLERIAGHLASVIQNSIVFEQTQAASLTDALTGLSNRRALSELLAERMARAEREGVRLAVLLIDLDKFKGINDRWGHDAGDRALRVVASVMRAMSRPYDISARYAGDEFVLVLWDCDEDQAERRSRDLQAAVAEAGVDVGEGERVGLSISVGAAIFPSDGRSLEDLLAEADERMYRNKASRREASAPQAPPAAA